MKICILGEGAWGTAVATLLVQNDHTVTVWCHDAGVVEIIKQTGVNERYLPGIKLDAKIHFTSDLKQAIENAQWIFQTTPVKYLRSVLEQVKPYVQSPQPWVILSKGIEKGTLLFPTQMIDQVLGFSPEKVVFAGPSFAHDLARKQPTAVTLASDTSRVAAELQKIITTNYFRSYICQDVIGVQVGAALKNVITLGIGLLDGAGFTDNTKAFFFTRGLQEMVQIATALGGYQETLYGLSGVGDLVLTAMGNLSRNLMIGRRLGKGETLEKIVQETGSIPEGINTVQSMYQLAEKYHLDLPVSAGIYKVIFKGGSIQNMLDELIQEQRQ